MPNTTWIKNLKTPIAVIGLGKSGIAALRLLKAVGFLDGELLSFDDKNTSADITNSNELLEKTENFTCKKNQPYSSSF